MDLLEAAIQQKKPISFEYNKPGEPPGLRFGNPHAIFISSANNMSIHIYQTSGVTESPLKTPLPSWRTFLLQYINNISVLSDKNSFEIAPGYNPNSQMYNRVIAKI